MKFDFFFRDLSEALVICFCGPDGAHAMFNNIPIMILLTNKNTALIYLVTVCEQKTNNNSVWREGAPNINSSTGTVVFIFGVDPL